MQITSLENRLKKIESYIPDYESEKAKVSKVSVGWHLDHSLKVINGVITTMKNSDITLYKNNFSLFGKFFFLLGYFPKGRAKAPKRTMPADIILQEDIINQLKTARNNINEIPNLNENAYFKHPIFGNINKVRVIRFLETHTNHHLKIIKNILK